MKNYHLLGVALLLTATLLYFTYAPNSSSKRSSPDDDIVKMENNVWQSLKDNDTTAFRSYFTPDYVAVYMDGVKKMDDEIGMIAHLRLDNFNISNTTVSWPNKETAIITYHVTFNGAYMDSNFTSNANAASVWVTNDGSSWKAAFHTEIPERVEMDDMQQ